MSFNSISSITPINANSNIINFKSGTNNVTKPYPNDSFQKTETGAGVNNGANNRLSAGAKLGIALGITAVAVSGIVLHKRYKNKALEKAVEAQFQELENNIPEAQKVFREVFFRKDITEAETKEILQGYKDIFKIKSDREYAKALFEHTKKNFQIYNPDMKIVFQTPKGHDGAYGVCTRLNSEIYVAPKTLKSGRKKVFETIHHEMRHAKQNEFIYHKYPDGSLEGAIYSEVLGNRYGDKDVLTQARCISDKNLRNEIDKKEHISEIIEKAFGKPSPDKVPPEYEDFTKELNHQLNTTIHYPNRLEEIDAFGTAKKITDFFFKQK